MWLLVAKTGGPGEVNDLLQYALGHADDAFRLAVLQQLEANLRRPNFGNPPKIASASLSDVAKAKGTTAQVSLRLLGLFKQEESRSLLEQHATTSDADPLDRAAAFDGLVSLGGPKTTEFLTKLAAKDQPSLTRRLAAQAMANLDLAKAAAAAADILATAEGKDDPSDLLSAFVARKGGPAALAKALGGKTIPADAAKVGLRAIRSSSQNVPDLVACPHEGRQPRRGEEGTDRRRGESLRRRRAENGRRGPRRGRLPPEGNAVPRLPRHRRRRRAGRPGHDQHRGECPAGLPRRVATDPEQGDQGRVPRPRSEHPDLARSCPASRSARRRPNSSSATPRTRK